MYILWQTAFCLKYIGQPTGAHLALCFKSVEQLQCLCSRIHSISVCVNSWRAVCCFFIDRPISTCVNLRQTVCCFKSINPTLSACVICGNPAAYRPSHHHHRLSFFFLQTLLCAY